MGNKTCRRLTVKRIGNNEIIRRDIVFLWCAVAFLNRVGFQSLAMV